MDEEAEREKSATRHETKERTNERTNERKRIANRFEFGFGLRSESSGSFGLDDRDLGLKSESKARVPKWAII